jgi:hypothetical protein
MACKGKIALKREIGMERARWGVIVDYSMFNNDYYYYVWGEEIGRSAEVLDLGYGVRYKRGFFASSF